MGGSRSRSVRVKEMVEILSEHATVLSDHRIRKSGGESHRRKQCSLSHVVCLFRNSQRGVACRWVDSLLM